MKNFKAYIDSTYLISEGDAKSFENFVQEAIDYSFKLVMIYPDKIPLARKIINQSTSNVLIGTVIDFPAGNGSCSQKIKLAKKAIDLGADELDFVIDYNAFLSGNMNKLENELISCTKLVIDHEKTIKWIIETCALSDRNIQDLCLFISQTIQLNFQAKYFSQIFTKSSTGFYKTQDNKANGATKKAIQLMVKYSYPLSVKASGGIRNFKDLKQMISLGASRIGTSSARLIINGLENNTKY
jgi:deoxyribose-phosphate aldolase